MYRLETVSPESQDAESRSQISAPHISGFPGRRDGQAKPMDCRLTVPPVGGRYRPSVDAKRIPRSRCRMSKINDKDHITDPKPSRRTESNPVRVPRVLRKQATSENVEI